MTTYQHPEMTSFLRTATVAEYILLRYGLALVLIWIGGMKFTSYEAHGIMGLEANSPFMRPLLAGLGVQGLADLLGVTEITTAILLITGRFFPRVGLVGSSIAILMFLTTLSFLITTPGWEPNLSGFPALAGAVGQFEQGCCSLGSCCLHGSRESAVRVQICRLRHKDVSPFHTSNSQSITEMRGG